LVVFRRGGVSFRPEARAKVQSENLNQPETSRSRVLPPAPRVGGRHAFGRYEELKLDAKRRRFIANATVVASTIAVLALAAVFNLLLSR
jgi:hypothetical protein